MAEQAQAPAQASTSSKAPPSHARLFNDASDSTSALPWIYPSIASNRPFPAQSGSGFRPRSKSTTLPPKLALFTPLPDGPTIQWGRFSQARLTNSQQHSTTRTSRSPGPAGHAESPAPGLKRLISLVGPGLVLSGAILYPCKMPVAVLSLAGISVGGRKIATASVGRDISPRRDEATQHETINSTSPTSKPTATIPSRKH